LGASTNMWSLLGSSRRYLGEGHTHLLSLLFCITPPPPFLSSLKPNSDDGMDQSSKMRAPQWVWDQVEHLITQPPRSAVIPVPWGVLEYTSRKTSRKMSRKTGEEIKYNTSRSLKSVNSACHLWEKMLQFPGHIYRDRDNNVIGASHFSPTDKILDIVISALGNKGMRRSLVTERRPPVALIYSHVAFNQ
jgi:hypothetical protein